VEPVGVVQELSNNIQAFHSSEETFKDKSELAFIPFMYKLILAIGGSTFIVVL
jgi:hypothetical protein